MERKNKTVLVTVSDDRAGRKGGKYSETQDQVYDLFKNSPWFGLDEMFFWKWEDIKKNEFYLENIKILDHSDPAMNGRCYKPFVILDGLKKIEDGDFLIYNDVSPEWWKNVDPINKRTHSIEVIKELCVGNGGILSSNVIWYCNGEIGDHTHENFTLERCINKMGLQEYKYSLQHASGMMVFQKSTKSMDFVEEWLKWNILDECASLGSVNSDPVSTDLCKCEYWHEESLKYGKIGHRHDQSISGLLINKIGNKLVRNHGNYNFLSFCMTAREYQFVDSNQPMSKYVYKNIFDGSNWSYTKLDRQ